MLKREFEELERQVKEKKQKLEEQNKISEDKTGPTDCTTLNLCPQMPWTKRSHTMPVQTGS